ncbi:MAG: hypothetical protein M0Z61_17010 [Nitrospiraceae bacterium]|nr:hypothetical protein [Nitrospiraceae bacterium]
MKNAKILQTVLIVSILLVSVFVTFADAFGDGDDTYTQIQEMVNDLGAPPYRAQNNGKVQQCADGGTKEITIKHSKYGTSYKGIYKKCREYGQYRNGRVEISTGN